MTGSGRRRAGRAVAVVSVVVAVGGAAAAATGFGFWTGDAAQPRNTEGNKPPALATVTRQTLVDTQSEYGTLGYGATTKLSSKLDGTVTALPPVGSTVERGQAVFRVDDTPVVLLYGPLPAYRPLAIGTEGADVRQFEENLAALGYRGFTVDDEYSTSTATAVKKWEEDLGLPKTGTVALGRVVYLPGPVRVDSHEAGVGDAAQPGSALLSGTGTTRVVTVGLDMSDQRLARTGDEVTLTLPDGRKIPGKITALATVVDPGDGDSPTGDQEPTTKIQVTVSVADQQALSGLDAASVRVGFTASQRENVLTVPVAALLALAEGGYGVQIVDGGGTRIVAVQTGMFAGGRVEVAGDGLTDGTTVGMPS
jgi:peptidoglycan hydrolase-like protein with peptidoglycan-binding domain